MATDLTINSDGTYSDNIPNPDGTYTNYGNSFDGSSTDIATGDTSGIGDDLNTGTFDVVGFRNSLGLPSDPSTWSYDQRVQYLKAFSAYITQNPSQFNSISQSAAEKVQATTYPPLEDVSFSAQFSQFASAFGDEVVAAANSVAGVGQGVLSAFSLAKYLIPISLVIAVVILLFALKKKVS